MSSLSQTRRFASATEWLAAVVIPPDTSAASEPTGLAEWLDAQADGIRARSADNRHEWLAGQVAALATIARMVDAKSPADYDDRIATLEAEREFALGNAVYAADLAGVDVQAQFDTRD